jgi:UDP-MurNAc hydroxylase
MTFFKALSPERIAYVERCHRTARRRTDEFFERDGWRIERWCPHRQADLTRFGEIADGILTCSLHHWRFDLETGRCLTSDDRHLRCERVAPD